MPLSAIGENPANAGVARLCGVSPYPVPDTDTALPNVARYQLRHTPMGEKIQFFGQTRKWSNLWSKVFCRNTRWRKSEKMREKRRFYELSAVGSRGGHTLPNQARYQTSLSPDIQLKILPLWSNMWSREFYHIFKELSRAVIGGNWGETGECATFREVEPFECSSLQNMPPCAAHLR